MRKKSLFFRLLFLAVPFVLCGQSSSLLLRDTFRTNERTKQLLPDTAAWFVSDARAVDYSLGRFALQVPRNGTIEALAHFTDDGPIRLLPGQRMEIRFTFEVVNPSTLGAGFRFGLFDSSMGNRLQADFSRGSNPEFSGYQGYGVFFNLNTGQSVAGALRIQRREVLMMERAISSGEAFGEHLVQHNQRIRFASEVPYQARMVAERVPAGGVRLRFELTGPGPDFPIRVETVDRDNNAVYSFDTLMFYSSHSASDGFTLRSVEVSVTPDLQPENLVVDERELPAVPLRLFRETTGTTPLVLAYNLGNFYPGSNTADWWRYTGVTGARVFLTPSHFQPRVFHQPVDETIQSASDFIRFREALRTNPEGNGWIDWDHLESRFHTIMGGRNRMIPYYALQRIRETGGDILGQISMGNSDFPVADDQDWVGVWRTWRFYYAMAFYLAREFGVERFNSHNEPNHSNTLIDPESFLRKLIISSDAARAALEDVNRLYGTQLTLRFTTPATASAMGRAFTEYGQPALEQLQRTIFGEEKADHRNFHFYSYQSYRGSPGGFTSDFLRINSAVQDALPRGVEPMGLGLTEYNVHSGRIFDGMLESSNDISRAVRFGAINSELVVNGVEELYAFKFGMTSWPSNSDRRFPVQKNGNLFTDNDNAPFDYGTAGRSAEAYRLFVKGFAPGNDLLRIEAQNSPVEGLYIAAARNPQTGFHFVYLTNLMTRAFPVDLDLRSFGLPDNHPVWIEEVSEEMLGTIREIGRIQDGRLRFRKTEESVVLLSIPPVVREQVLNLSDMVVLRDGVHADKVSSPDLPLISRNDGDMADRRSVVLLRSVLPRDLDLSRVKRAVLVLPLAAEPGAGGFVQAHIYGTDHADWSPSSATWATSPNLRQGSEPGLEIRHRSVQGAGDSLHILGQLSASEAASLQGVDVTFQVRRAENSAVAFLVSQDPRWDVNIKVEDVPDSWDAFPRGDLQAGGLRVLREGEGGSALGGPRLILYLMP